MAWTKRQKIIAHYKGQVLKAEEWLPPPPKEPEEEFVRKGVKGRKPGGKNKKGTNPRLTQKQRKEQEQQGYHHSPAQIQILEELELNHLIIYPNS